MMKKARSFKTNQKSVTKKRRTPLSSRGKVSNGV
jgi:hypothetical protein